MPAYQINVDEEYAMRGLTHVARLVYLYLRQHMDYETGITGIQRKVSLQSISEYLYVDPHQGIKEESYSHKQVRSALDWLEKAGLIERDKSSNRANRQSVFKLILATTDYSAKNKVGRGRADEVGRGRADPEEPYYNGSDGFEYEQVGNTNIGKVGNPPFSDIYNTTHNARAKYPMSLDWVPPDKNILKRLLLNAGIKTDTQIPFDVISEFRAFWAGRDGVYKNTYEWTHTLVSQFKYKLQREKANANGNRNNGGYTSKAQPIDLNKMANEEF